MNYLAHAYCTETRPYNQGSRLTAFELVYENIPSTLITDSMAGSLFARFKESRNISAVIVGADRVVRNGDTANKIGTYSLAVLAKAHGIKFVVAAPTTSIDLETATGKDIVIEDRKGQELTQMSGPVIGPDGQVNKGESVRIATAHQGIDVWNPGFDVTPAALIDAVITERGEVLRNSNGVFNFESVMPERWAEVVKGVDSLGKNGVAADLANGLMQRADLNVNDQSVNGVNGTNGHASSSNAPEESNRAPGSSMSEESTQFQMDNI